MATDEPRDLTGAALVVLACLIGSLGPSARNRFNQLLTFKIDDLQAILSDAQSPEDQSKLAFLLGSEWAESVVGVDLELSAESLLLLKELLKIPQP